MARAGWRDRLRAAPGAVWRAVGAVRRHRNPLMPRGPFDPFIQFLIVAAAYYAWRYARGAVDGSIEESIAHAQQLIDVERSLHLLYEPALQGWAIDAGWPADFARWGYANLHFNGSCLALTLVYFLRPGSFPFVRNMLIAAMAISTVGYALYPTAPPRFITELGLETSQVITGNAPLNLHPTDPWYNPVAAVPSMHVGLAFVFSWSLALLTRNRVLRTILLAYPLLMTFVTVVTANHFWLDAFLGGITAALSAAIAIALGRLYPNWAFRASVPSAERKRAGPQPEPEAEAATA